MRVGKPGKPMGKGVCKMCGKPKASCKCKKY